VNKLADLISRWDEDEGKPYKGELFDFDSYDGEGEPPLSCMCAQGQVLHVVAGWSVDDFRESGQTKADREVAKLLNISTAHSILLRTINDKRDGAPSVVLTDPGKVLGDQWSKLLDFWWHLDQMTAEQWAAARDAAGAAAWAAAWAAARDAAGVAAWAAAWAAARDAARDAAGAAARDAAWDAAWDAAYAASEIQGAKILKANGKGFYFLPMFGFATPDDIPVRPANYREAA
jgi:hypothetical protein